MRRSNSRYLLMAMGLVLPFSGQAHGQDSRVPVPPPPGMHDPGVKPAAASSAQVRHARTSFGEKDGLPSSVVERAAKDARGEPPPTVDIRTIGKDKVEEYRINGRLYMIHVIPEHGVPQTYMTNSQGELMPKAGQPPVNPVFYTIYKWGGSSKHSDNGN